MKLVRNLARTISSLMLAAMAAPAFGEDVTYYHHDATGTPVVATDATGTVIWRKVYRPYGSEYSSTDVDKGIIGYTGHRTDEDFGLTYAGARYFDPEVGRFTGRDPAGLNPNDRNTFNPYVYANSNPYRYVDPDGREVVSLNSEDNSTLATYINSLASGEFRFDKNNRLQMVSDSGGEGGSSYYTERLGEAISSDSLISIEILHGPGTTIKDVKTSANRNNGNSYVTITNDTYPLLGIGPMGPTGPTVVQGTPATNLAHELVEHAIPNTKGIETKNRTPAFRENIVRRENDLPRRSGDDH